MQLISTVLLLHTLASLTSTSTRRQIIIIGLALAREMCGKHVKNPRENPFERLVLKNKHIIYGRLFIRVMYISRNTHKMSKNFSSVSYKSFIKACRSSRTFGSRRREVSSPRVRSFWNANAAIVVYRSTCTFVLIS